MPLHDNAKNAMLDELDTIATHASLHTAWSATGANEVTGGSPAYARQTIAFDAAANGTMTITGTEVFDVPGSTTVQFVGLWSALTSGTFYGMFPLGGSTANSPQIFLAEESTDVFKSDAHGLSDDDEIFLFGPNLPTGVTEGTKYFVVTSTTDTFQVSTTSGGSAVNITADGRGIWQKLVEETFGAQGTLTISDMDIGLNLLT